MTAPRFSVLIVGYNSFEDIRTLLESLRELPSWAHCEILLAENGAEEIPEMERLASDFQARLVVLPNPGFGKACNTLAKFARGEIILLVNPDLRFDQDILPGLAERLESPDVGAVGPVLQDEDGTEQISWNLPMGLWWEFLEAHYLHTWWRWRLIRRYRRENPRGPWKVGIATAACLAMNRKLFERLGGFHEGFFLNCEDIDLCDRIHQLGLGVLVDPGLEAFHGNSRIQGRNLRRFVADRLDGKWVYLPRRYRGWKLTVARMFWIETALLRLTTGLLVLRGEDRSRLPGYWRPLMKLFKA